MSRILRHIGRNDFKKTRQRQVVEQKERAAKKLKEEVERKKLEEASRPYKSNWRKENLREFGEWAPIETSGPANSTSTTFGYFSGGSPVINSETGQQVTFTYSGLNGVENYPTTVTIDQGGGDTFQTAPPPFSQVGVQGYTAKLNPRYAEAQKKYQEEMKEWERKKEQQQKDIEATLKSFGTSFKELRSSKYWIKKLGDGTFVAIQPTVARPDVLNWTHNVRIIKLKQAANADPMYIDYNPREVDPSNGKRFAYMARNVEIQNDVYLNIGQPPKAPIEQEYLMPRRTDFKDVNPQLDASQEFAQKVGADTIMNARVQDTPNAPDPYSIMNVDYRNPGSYPAPIPILDYGTNIAKSIIANKPIRIPQSQIPQDHIDKLVQGISNSPGTLYSIPINTKEQPYSDENIYELSNGEVRTHTAGTKARYPDNTMPVDYNNLGFHGINNPLAAAGQAQLQFVRPKKGEPYLVYTDHAYRNLTSTDSGEATNNFLIKSLDKGLHTILGKGDPNEPNTGAMANYPPNIKGDVRKQIRVPYSQLPQNMKDRIDSAR